MCVANYAPFNLQTLQRVDLPDPVTAVTAGHYHTIALTTSGEQLQCCSELSAVTGVRATVLLQRCESESL